ncbi:phosphate signaling complex PhoU family protein [Leptolyngbya sp. 7M]|uniref:phosphate signaling complex PhoU family protein n=1 Tax=Leptolyngbya sp. 7M TaxID=2812896 RepID=UPI001CEC00F8|nr:PhoU domain-containing protein [Leptolyngbya sp. 7M]
MEDKRPTRLQFERQLRRVQRDVLRMGALVEHSCWLARKALCERDLEAAYQISVQDKQIDQLYRQIEVDCVNLMALQAPVTQDLRLLSALMQLIRDLERIGDYAEDIGEIAVKLFPYPVQPCMERVQIMLDRCRAMLAMGLAALSDLDAESGLDIKLKDDAVDSDYESLYNLLVHHTDITDTIEPTVPLPSADRQAETCLPTALSNALHPKSTH